MSIFNATAPSGGSASAVNVKTATITTTSSVPLVFDGFDSVPSYYLLVKGADEVGGSAPSGAQDIEVYKGSSSDPSIVSGTLSSSSSYININAYTESAPTVNTSNHTLTFNTYRSRGVYYLYYL